LVRPVIFEEIRLRPRCSWRLRCSGMLRGIGW